MSEQTKTTIRQAAIRLFYANGYHGTSVRDISKEAEVNAALISYYFGGKQSLFESLLTEFFEGYIHSIEETMLQSQENPESVLDELFLRTISYQQSCHLLARMAHREMTLDSVLVREMMSTYLRKEQYLLEQIVQFHLYSEHVNVGQSDLLVLQLRNILTLPFSSPQYLRELFMLTSADHHFVNRYAKHATSWMKALLRTQGSKNKKLRMVHSS